MKSFFILIAFFFGFSYTLMSQFGIGLKGTLDAYQRYANPLDPDDGTKSNSAGHIGGVGIGPKIWIGGENFSVSFEGEITYGTYGYSFNDDKGYGILAFPLLMKFNRNGASGFFRKQGAGISLGGGIQYNRTEVFRDWEAYPDLKRTFFPTYIGELGLHAASGDGADLALYLRLGYGEKEARSLNVGIIIQFNYMN